MLLSASELVKKSKEGRQKREDVWETVDFQHLPKVIIMAFGYFY